MRGNINSIGDMFALTTEKYPTKTAIWEVARFEVLPGYLELLPKLAKAA